VGGLVQEMIKYHIQVCILLSTFAFAIYRDVNNDKWLLFSFNECGSYHCLNINKCIDITDKIDTFLYNKFMLHTYTLQYKRSSQNSFLTRPDLLGFLKNNGMETAKKSYSELGTTSNPYAISALICIEYIVKHLANVSFVHIKNKQCDNFFSFLKIS
jgi:hypothetical protein